MPKHKKKTNKRSKRDKETRMHQTRMQQIESQYPDVEKTFWINDLGSLSVGFIDYHACTTYGTDDTWDSVKLRIDAIINNTKDVDCPVCLEPIAHRVSCSVCIGSCCAKCYADMYRKNEGQSICPICRYTIGKKEKASDVERGYQIILLRFSLFPVVFSQINRFTHLTLFQLQTLNELAPMHNVARACEIILDSNQNKNFSEAISKWITFAQNCEVDHPCEFCYGSRIQYKFTDDEGDEIYCSCGQCYRGCDRGDQWEKNMFVLICADRFNK